MNTSIYKSIVVDSETYEFIKAQALEDERNISKTLKKYFYEGVNSEINDSLIDSKLVKGGTPRLHRLLGDLRWYRENASNQLDQKYLYIVDKKELEAIDVVIAALADTVE